MDAANERGGESTPPRRILLVDDERRNRQLLEVMLSGDGYLFLSAASGDDALAIARREHPDLVLLDVMMPGLDGYQVAAQLKGDVATAHIPIIMLTALDDRNSRAHGLIAGAQAFLPKPVNGDDLRTAVELALSTAGRDDDSAGREPRDSSAPAGRDR